MIEKLLSDEAKEQDRIASRKSYVKGGLCGVIGVSSFYVFHSLFTGLLYFAVAFLYVVVQSERA